MPSPTDACICIDPVLDSVLLVWSAGNAWLTSDRLNVYVMSISTAPVITDSLLTMFTPTAIVCSKT